MQYTYAVSEFPSRSPTSQAFYGTEIRMVLPEHADAIIAYSVKHDYDDILRVAAPLMLHKPLDEIVSRMPANLVIPWVSTILLAEFLTSTNLHTM